MSKEKIDVYKINENIDYERIRKICMESDLQR